MRKNKRIVISWYTREGAVERVKQEAKIRDLETEIKYNMKSSDLMDFEKFLNFMIASTNCSCSVINLSYCKIKIKLHQKAKHNFDSVYQVEILDKYINSAYVNETVSLKHLFCLIHDTLSNIESNSNFRY